MKVATIGVVAIAWSAVLSLDAQVFRTGTEGVRVSVLATDNGRPIAGLRAADFEVRDNGVPQRVDLAPAGGPIAVTLVLDVSASVRGRPLERLIAAADAVLGAVGQRDRVALMTFAAPVDLLALPTTDVHSVRTQLRDVRAAGSTSLVDATAAALVVADREADPGLVLIFSDGDDNTSWLTAASVQESAARSESVIYAVTLRSLRRLSLDAGTFLDAITGATGGSVEHVESDESIRSTFLHILQEFRHRYVLTYVPSGPPKRGWHDLDVRLRGRPGKVTARGGYWARD